jgi:hypothetical protein
VFLLGTLRRGVRLIRSASLVTYGYPHQVVPVVQLAHHTRARAVHDGVGDQLGDDEDRRVTGVVGHVPAGEPGARQVPGLSHGTRVCGQLEAEPALGGGARAHPCGGTQTGAVLGGVCS